MAQPGNSNGHNQDARKAWKKERKADRKNPREVERRDENQERDRDRDHDRGAGPDHAFYRGERLPQYYRSHQYVVDDWRGHGLHAPPRGYHWVQTGGDYVLVAIATGIILELLLNR